MFEKNTFTFVLLDESFIVCSQTLVLFNVSLLSLLILFWLLLTKLLAFIKVEDCVETITGIVNILIKKVVANLFIFIFVL